MASRALKVDPRKATVSTQEPHVTEDEIAVCAYRLWNERGCPIGSDQEDWFEAERQLKGQREQSPRSSRL